MLQIITNVASHRLKQLPTIKLLCLLLALALSQTAFALDISNKNNHYPLTPELSWFEDKSQLITINEIVQAETLERFQRHHQASFNLGRKDSSLWLHIKLNNTSIANNFSSDRQPNWFLSIEYPQIDHIEIYEKTRNGNIKRSLHGDSLRFEQRSIQHRHFIQPLQLADQEAIELFIKIESTSTLKIPVHLYSEIGLAEKYTQEGTVHGIYFGIMIAMFLYNFFMYLTLRDKSYIHYMGYILCFSLLQATLVGYSYQYLWPQRPDLNSSMIIILISLACFFGCSFTNAFLSFNNRIASFSTTLELTALLALLLAGASLFIDYSIPIEAALFLTLATSFVIIAAAVGNIIKGDFAARFFLLAWLFLLPGASIFALMSANYLPSNIFTENAALAGSALEVILLSLALGNRISDLRKRHLAEAKLAQTKIENAYKKLNEALLKQEKNNRLKDQFLATISHELRTPMNGVEGALGLMDTHSIPQSQSHYINAAINSAKKMTSLIDSILNFSEIQAGTVNIKYESFEIRPLFNKLADQYRSRCKIKDVDFQWQIDKQVPHFIVGDHEQLALALGQLVDNAIKFTESGRITVNIFTQQENNKDTLILSVIDTGKGICNTKLKSIFNDFQQADADYNRRYGGLGIGLAICHRLSFLMDGKLTVESTLDEGSQFNFSIPLLKPESNVAESYQQDNTAKKVALIAEDNPVNQMVLKAMLEKLGCIVLTAKDGQETITTLKEQPVDIVLMDCQMPGMDGFEATRQIRDSRSGYSNIPIIAVTANAMTSDNARCLAEGMNDYIKKPINNDILNNKVNQWLAKRAV